MPRIFFTSAEFCRPGSWIAMRSTPSRATCGSETASSGLFKRLRKMTMFCWTAESCRSLISCGVSSELERRRAADRGLGEMQVAVVREDGGVAFRQIVRILEQHAHAVAGIVHHHVLIGHVRVAERCAKVLLAVIEQLLDGARDIDLIDEVHAAAQIEAELQRAQADAAHPVRHARGLRERHGELVGRASVMTSRAFS